jgi:hypothetical protein
MMDVVFVLYGQFRSNSAGHVIGFAKSLGLMGVRSLIVGDGNPAEIERDGKTSVSYCARNDLFNDPRAALTRAFGIGPWANLIVHGWTPRQSVCQTLRAIRRVSSGPDLVHLEDNEDALRQAHMGASSNATVPSFLTDPIEGRRLLENAHAVTIITEKLSDFVPKHVRTLVLEPGTDAADPLDDTQRAAVKSLLGIDPTTKMIFYPGNLHPANAREVFGLYVSVLLLNRRGIPVKLVRSGDDYCTNIDPSYQHLKDKVAIDLGYIDQPWVHALAETADLLVQPGAPGPFNNYRLPSKVPEFLASGRPVLMPRTNIGLEISDGVEAVLLDKGDGTEIADRAETILRNPRLGNRIGAAGRKFAKRFNWQVSAQKLLNLYREISNHS